MNQLLRIVIPPMLFAAIFSACGPEPSFSSFALSEGKALLVVSDGDVSLRRTGWADYHPATFGAILQTGDLLKVSNEAKVVILCDNLTLWYVPGGEAGVSNGCPSTQEPVIWEGQSELGNTRGKDDPLIPYIVSPRSTKLLSPEPILRWNEVSAGTTYHVQVTNSANETVWDTTADHSGIAYAGTALRPGDDFLLTVETDTGASSAAEDVPSLGFGLLSEAEIREVEGTVKKISDLKLPAPGEALARAHFYAGNTLNAEAIETLEALVSEVQTAAVYRTLGDLYLQIGLNRLAGQRYLRAADLAQAGGDIEVLAAAQAGLGRVSDGLGKTAATICWYEHAKSNYALLYPESTDSPEVSQLEERINEIAISSDPSPKPNAASVCEAP